MDFLTDTVFAEFERSDFIGGIDNEALDFGHLDQFIHVATSGGQPPTPGGGNGGNVTTPGGTVTVATPTALGSVEIGVTTATSSAQTQSHLPESPPDSGSEPPYSPADLQGLTLSANGTNGTNVSAAIQQPGTPQQQNLTSDLTTLTDISQASIDLNNVTHHHNHLSILNSHHHHHQQNQQQQQQHHHHHHHHHHPNALYIRTDLPTDQQVVNGGITIRKHEDILLTAHQPDPQLILQQTGANILELERSYTHPQANLLSLGPVQINTDDLSRLMPEVYAPSNGGGSGGSHSTTPVPVPVSQRSNIPTPANTRKRKLSQADIGTSIVKPEPGSSLSPICQQHLDPDSPVSTNLPAISSNLSIPDTSLDSSVQNPDSTDPCPLQCIRFTPFQQQNWHVLCDQSLQELPVPHYRVDADKGFNFSNSDDAFVCQKKNHFQITCHAQLQGAAAFVRTSSGLEKIKSFHLHFYGVKLEAPNHTIRVEQSQSDRSKKPFHPVPCLSRIDLQNRLVSKVTVGRLHFSETTSNNMRKKGRPNPEQRYFQLVVGLHAHTHSGHFPVVSQGSERIIVRASNPGQFESDVELCWQRGVTQESIYHAGRVGINTDRPDESLVVHGNLKVSGHIVQPSDSRAKQEISELDTSEQLKNLQKIRVVKYRYEPEFAVHSGLKGKNDAGEIVDTGVIAQEVREVLPDAVQEAGSIVLPNGQVIENFLLVNKDRILMENIGAVKELCKVTGSLETRIEQLEKINSRLVRIQKLDRNHNCKTKKCKHILDDYDDATDEICSNKTIQMIIIILVIIMAICLAAISTLYFVEHSKQRDRYYTHFSRYIAQESIIFNSNNGYLIDGRRHYNHDTYKSNSLMNSFTIRTPQYPTAGTVSPLNDDHQSILTYQHLMNDHGLNTISPNTSKVSNSLKVNSLKWSPSVKDDEQLASDESSSEKAAETIILPQDVENNSIDGDNQKQQNKLQFSSQKLQNNTITSDFGKDIQSIANKTRPDNEDNDLQYLNISDSEDQTLIEITNNLPLIKAVPVEPIGIPSHCETTKAENVLCQSACCDETNNLSIQIADIDQSNHNSYELETNPNGTLKAQTAQKTLANEEQPIELRDPDITESDHRSRKLAESKRKIPQGERKLGKDCFPIVFWIRSETFNVTLGTEMICLNNGQTQNITYSIPVSKYMKETKIELHFTGSNSLQWALCSTKEHTTRNYIASVPETNNNIDGNKILQKNTNKSVFHVNIPSCGYFERLVELRASFDPVKNTCQEQGDEVNTLLQYNIRLFRECE